MPDVSKVQALTGWRAKRTLNRVLDGVIVEVLWRMQVLPGQIGTTQRNAAVLRSLCSQQGIVLAARKSLSRKQLTAEPAAGLRVGLPMCRQGLYRRATCGETSATLELD